jgi:uncharacterized protein
VADPIVFHPRRPCAICKKPSHPKFHPFCSNRCAQIDLNRWLGGKYVIPAVETDEEDSSNED